MTKEEQGERAFSLLKEASERRVDVRKGRWWGWLLPRLRDRKRRAMEHTLREISALIEHGAIGPHLRKLLKKEFDEGLRALKEAA
jgi:hypothetical protein